MATATRAGSAAKKSSAAKKPAAKPKTSSKKAGTQALAVAAAPTVTAPQTRVVREEPQTPSGCAIGLMAVLVCLGMSAVILLGGGLSKAIDRALPEPKPVHAAPAKKAPTKAPARAETGALTCEQLIERGMGWACGGPK
ncbi:hypothetical protein WDJ50_18445 (plasmid) [Deinococcus sp. VB142]|uniref:Uncharacterized protein n=1 Tax=Deinococcus sp. VB142 TaxID=3112952 RepID=A0AAU6Q7Y9_9DEIO